jgi:FkbH-like protein
MNDIMTKEKKLSAYTLESKKINVLDFKKQIRIALLSSFTLDGLGETIKVKGAEINVGCHVFSGGYNQYNEEILNTKSKLYAFSPDICFLILDIRDIFGDLFYSPYNLSVEKRREFIQNKVDELVNLAKSFIEKSNSKFVISNFAIPTYSPYGIFENKTDYGLQEMVFDLNHKLNNVWKSENSVYFYDLNGFVSRFGQNNVFDYRQYFLGDLKISLNHIPFLANDLLGFIKPILGFNKKCIVLDLDNTLWGGIIGEDGFNGIKLSQNDPIGKAFIEFQKYLLSLHERGIILAVNSKNNLEDAIQVIKEHPNMVLREKHFSCLKINWNDKVINLQEIAQELNIGLDSILFMDDDQVNRDYVREALPEVLTIELPNDPSLYALKLTELNDFNVIKITGEDKKRGEMYLQQRRRTEFQKTTINFEEYLKKLNIKIHIKKADEFTIPRISQLILKTNQFNLTTKRYQEEDVIRFSQDEKKIVGCALIEDKFGDYGITGVFIVNKDNPEEWVIDTFLLSCRVIGRGIEEGILDYIINMSKKNNVKRLVGNFIPTKKNKPSESFLPNFGFKKENNCWVYSLKNYSKKPSHLLVLGE